MSITKKQVISKLSVFEARKALEDALEREKKAISKKNKEFRRLPDYKQRMTIAKDVLDQLKIKRFIPKFGTYFNTNDPQVNENFANNDSCQVNEVLAGVKCEVCGIGSLFVAMVDRANDCSVSELPEINSGDFMRDYLEQWFRGRQLDLIEVAFEGRIIDARELDYDDSDVIDAIKFTKNIDSPDDRIKKIMKNIIENEGTFIP